MAKLNFADTLKAFSTLATLIISVASLFISYNTYKNTENINRLNNKQGYFEMRNALSDAFTISDMLVQSNPDTLDVRPIIQSLSEIKALLVTNQKNSTVIICDSLGYKYAETLARLNFNIKFLQSGVAPNSVVVGVRNVILETKRNTRDLFTCILKCSNIN